MAIDQYGQAYHGLVKPRQDLLRLFNRKSARKMYVDKKDGTCVHIGYIIAGLWLTIYKVERVEKVA